MRKEDTLYYSLLFTWQIGYR